jgi:hypothetical protein
MSRFYTAFLEELASHGYVVAAITHTLWAPVTVFADGTTIAGTHASGANNFESIVWSADAQFVLDQISAANTNDPAAEIAGHLDLAKIGMFGHSFGGSTSVALMNLDSRVLGAMNLDGTLFGYAKSIPPSRAIYLFESDRAGDATFGGAFASATGPALWTVLSGGAHLNLGDFPIIVPALGVDPSAFNFGSIDPTRAIRIVNAYLLAFFGKVLNGTASPLLDGPSSEFPEITQFQKRN